MNKNLKKWSDFIKVFEDFNDKSFPNLLKKICSIIRKDIMKNGNNSYDHEYQIDSFNIIIKINYIYGHKEPYYSNINIHDILTKPDESVVIPINVTDLSIDVNYLMSIISHEIRHIYDIYTVSNDSEMKDFVKSITTTKYKNKYSKFINLVYLSLEHELIARHNMLYEMYRHINITDKEKLYKLFKESYVYKALMELQKFNYLEFINRDDILNFTYEFSKSIGDEFNGNLNEYYEKWDIFFKQKSNEFLKYVDKMLIEIINDVNNNMIYERLCGYISYNENINNDISLKILENMILTKNNII